ncbi:MAG: UDP-glucose 4-epimerase [Blastocatellia bacterium]|jgi:UDP-glucose 4-epimerase|nr:UDP-glucose 4-epimerase [Blastocatellia bacterium]
MPLSGIVLVTGGAGFIGSHIVDALLKSGARVRVVDNLSTGRRENLSAVAGRIDFLEGDLADPAIARSAVEDVELIFHEAALPSVPRSIANPRETHLASVEGTFNLLLAAKDKGVRRLVYAASSSAYGDQPTSPKTESMRPEPLSPYAAAKLVGEYYCQVFYRSYGLETVCLRYFNVFGPRQDPSSPYSGVISQFTDRLLRGERPVIYGDGEQTRDFTYVSNAVEANMLAGQTGRGIGEVINVANGEQVTINQLFELIRQITGREGIEPEYKEARTGDILHSLADIDRASDRLGYQPKIGLREGLEFTIAASQKLGSDAK